MDNKSWRSISNMKQNDNTVNSHIPNCNSFSINENCVKQIQNTEPNPIYEQSSELFKGNSYKISKKIFIVYFKFATSISSGISTSSVGTG